MKIEEKDVRKLIEEYESRIKDCDILLAANKERNRKLRNNFGASDEMISLSRNRATENAKRQSYVQFIANLKELFGEM